MRFSSLTVTAFSLLCACAHSHVPLTEPARITDPAKAVTCQKGTELSRGVDLLASLPHAPALSWQGQRPGSLGETAAWLIAAGGVAMIFLRIISWHIPLAMLAGIALPAAIANAVAHAIGKRFYETPITSARVLAVLS